MTNLPGRRVRHLLLLFCASFVTLRAQVPSVVSLSPIASSGTSRTFTLTFSDSGGYQNLSVVDLLVNNFLDGRQACYLAYAVSSNALFLVDDGGDAGGPYAGGLILNGSGTMNNSQCTVSGAGSSVSKSGNMLTLTLAVMFSASFGGDKVLYLAAGDTLGVNTGWQPLGTLRTPPVSPAYPAISSVTPNSGSGATQSFSVVYQDATSAANISGAQVLIANAIDGRHACYVAYSAASNALFLVDDGGDAGGPFAGGIVVGTAGSMNNSQCTIQTTANPVTKSGQNLTLTFTATFTAPFSGPKIMYLGTQTTAGANSDWHALGAWLVTGAGPTITNFNPKTGPAGTLVTISGGNFGSAPQVTMPGINGGTIALPLQSVGTGSLVVLVPSGAVTGAIKVANSGASTATASAFSVTAPSTFTLTASPPSATLIQGQSVAYSVQLASANGFNQLAQLSVTGLPSGITAAFKPSSITGGQTSVLTLTAPANQAISSGNITISAAATVSGIPLTQSAQAMLVVTAPTTTLLGRTVVADSLETPLAGVTVTTLGLDGNGNATGCTGHSTVADAAGNFLLTNLPMQCTGLQLIGFDGTTATKPAGKYAGVNLVFTLVAAQVTASPVLVHLPRIDNVETFYVQQNSASNQSYSFTTIPGLSVIVYAGTTFTMADGTKPNPFPLAAVQVPPDRLPDAKPNVPTMVRVFIVAFQPANTVASQPVAVSFPNVSNTAPGTDMALMTLDPTHGTMVPYGTGAVSANGMQVVPDPDPAHPGHLYGLVHFDWHGQMPPPPNATNPCLACLAAQIIGGAFAVGGAPVAVDPVDLSSGLQTLNVTDINVSGTRGSIGIQRTYRTLSTYNGAFGQGHDIQYAWQLNTGAPNSAAAINLIRPDGNQILFSRQPDGTLTNSSVPSEQGAVMTTNSSGQTSLRFPDGTVYQFQGFGVISYLSAITDRNGNVTTITQSQMGGVLRITQITDPVGRSISLTYNGTWVASATDPIGRTVNYSYNPSGTLATVTDPNGGVTTYQYDSQNRMTSMVDPRGVTMFQDSFDTNGRVSQQIRPDGGVFQFAYTLANPLVSTSPVIATTVTDALGNPTTYRFNVQGFPTDVTDALGQTKSFTLSPGSNLVTQVSGPVQCAICGTPGQGPVSYTYDGNGNTLTSTDALGNTTAYTYDPVFNQVTSVTDPLGHTRTFAYDGSGNLTAATDQNGNKSTFSYNTNGLLVQATDPLGNKTSIGYDTLGNPVSVTDPLGNVSTSAFDGVSRLVSATDPMGRMSKVAFDALDRVVSAVDGRGSTTQFSYDPSGNLLKLTDPRNNSTAFVYDALSRITTRTSPLGKSETYQYDLNGNLTQFIDRRSQTSKFQYDPLNRLSNETYQDGSTVTRAYDPYSRLLTVNDSVGGLFGFGYDANGSLVSQSEPTGSISYTRDPLQRVATRQVAGQNAVTYTYDPAGNLLSASMPGAGMSYSYDPRNLPVTASRTNGVATSMSYDPLGRVLSLIHAKGSSALNTQTYSYDSAGYLITTANDISQPLITQAAAGTVDQANELLTNGTTTYTNDANGNRLTETGAGGSLTYVWDSRNRLSAITDASGNTTVMHYDYARNLLEVDRTTSGATTTQKFLVDSLTNVVSLTDSSGLPVSVLTGQSIDSHYASIDSAGNITFGIGDQLGSTTGVTNSTGSVASKLDYEPYGQTTGSAPATYPFAYTGRVPALGNIYYYRNRFYDAGTGRFLSEDPLRRSGISANLYQYSFGDPTDYTDPTGTDVRVYWDVWPSIHKKVEIDTTGGQKWVGFGPSWTAQPFSPGEIDINSGRYGNSGHGDQEGEGVPLTAHQGDQLLQEITQLSQKPPAYLFGSTNCWSFANWVQNQARNIYATSPVRGCDPANQSCL